MWLFDTVSFLSPQPHGHFFTFGSIRNPSWKDVHLGIRSKHKGLVSHSSTMDNAGFRQRIVGSARGLACSTFSGVVGIEAELRDPRASGKQQTVRGARNLEAVAAGNDRRRNGNTSSETSFSLRSSRYAGVHDESQREFDVFSEQSPSLGEALLDDKVLKSGPCLLYTSPSPRDGLLSRMPSSA